jgi:hypothetical protein
MHLWCELLPQATLTLSLMQTSRVNPTISADTQLYGQFDFNRTPLAPPGTRVVAHVNPKAHISWALHGEDAWYVGPAPDHYRCYSVWMTGTNKTIIVDTVEFFPQPHLSSYDMAIQSARQLTFALRNPAPAAPFPHIGHTQHEALARLATIFKEIAAPEPQHAEQESKTEPPSRAPITTMPPAEAPSSIPSLITHPRSSPPRVDTPTPRVGQATLGVAAPTTLNSHRRLIHSIKTPTTIPPFDLYKQKK